MMIISIIKKEWIKLKIYFITLLCMICGSVLYFLLSLQHTFSTTEPESMVWYQFSLLEDKPYFDFIYLFLIIGVVISLTQFLPEIIKNRIKIMMHLPQKLSTILFIHLAIGSVFVGIVSLLLSLFLLIIFYSYYPDIILSVISKDLFYYSLGAIIVYILVSSIIIEKKRFIQVIKSILLILFLDLFIKKVFLTVDILWIIFLFFTPFVALDSFYSIKKQRVETLYFKVFSIIILVFIMNSIYLKYSQNYKIEFNKYYIFYSNVIDDFVYQKNFGKHHFEYGIKDKNTFNQEVYESYLPFVYWKNLDIQNKLPIKISNKIYTKSEIKKSRLSFNYHPNYLKKHELNLYPLFNAQSLKGRITFPEEMLTYTADSFVVYNYDEKIDKKLTIEINEKMNTQNLRFPIKNIWGKPTNLKPYDKGYLVEDKNSNLFNLKRFDNTISIEQISYPNTVKLEYIKISENKQKQLLGYAIDKNGTFYLLTWDFKFVILNIDGFNYKTMKLKLIANPENYLIRYDDGKNYFAVVYDKKFKMINKIVFDK